MFCANSLAGRFQQAWLADFFSRCGWKSPVPALVLLVNPLTLNFGFGVAEWFRNRPSTYGWGLPSSDASNLDPDTRLYYARGGCVRVGGKTITLSQPTTAQILNDLDQTDFELGDDIVQRSVRAVAYKERCL